jgi:branched-subunit amino acid aminotransferase/4-amino-4-deoxychorismate lyase
MSKIVILKPSDAASLNPTCSGFAHGFGVFETIKLSAGRLCFWDAHWQRLCRSAKAFGLSLPVEADALLAAMHSLSKDTDLREGTVKVSLLKDGADSRLFVYARPAIRRPESVRLLLELNSPINERSPLAGHKTHNYMENMLLLAAARSAGYGDALRVNTDGVLAETTVGNLFFIEDGQLHTPALATGVLPGVVRGEVLVAARALSLKVAEGAYTPERLQNAEAVFMTNSSVGILPVDVVEGAELKIVLKSASHLMVRALTQALDAAEAESHISLSDD